MSASETQPGALPDPTVGQAITRPDRGGANGGQAVRLDPNNTPSAAGSSTPGNITNRDAPFSQGTTGG